MKKVPPRACWRKTSDPAHNCFTTGVEHWCGESRSTLCLGILGVALSKLSFRSWLPELPGSWKKEQRSGYHSQKNSWTARVQMNSGIRLKSQKERDTRQPSCGSTLNLALSIHSSSKTLEKLHEESRRPPDGKYGEPNWLAQKYLGAPHILGGALLLKLWKKVWIWFKDTDSTASEADAIN